MQCAQPDDGARHADLRPGPLISEPERETPLAAPSCTKAGSTRIVRGGTLDDTSWLRPTTHYWTRNAQRWIGFPEGDKQFETQPG
jgi:hypothetical protein